MHTHAPHSSLNPLRVSCRWHGPLHLPTSVCVLEGGAHELIPIGWVLVQNCQPRGLCRRSAAARLSLGHSCQATSSGLHGLGGLRRVSGFRESGVLEASGHGSAGPLDSACTCLMGGLRFCILVGTASSRRVVLGDVCTHSILTSPGGACQARQGKVTGFPLLIKQCFVGDTLRLPTSCFSPNFDLRAH